MLQRTGQSIGQTRSLQRHAEAGQGAQQQDHVQADAALQFAEAQTAGGHDRHGGHQHRRHQRDRRE